MIRREKKKKENRKRRGEKEEKCSGGKRKRRREKRKEGLGREGKGRVGKKEKKREGEGIFFIFYFFWTDLFSSVFFLFLSLLSSSVGEMFERIQLVQGLIYEIIDRAMGITDSDAQKYATYK